MSENPVTDSETLYSYDDYYSGGYTPAPPCNNANAKAFSEVFLPTLYSIVFIIGFIGNGLVVWVLIRYHHKSNMTDVCLLNLAISDLLFLLSLPFWTHDAMGEWIFGSFMCRAVTTLYMLGLYGSIFFMVLMTLDYYVVIVHAPSNRSANLGSFLALFVWILSICASLPNIIFTSERNETNRTSCSAHFPSSGWKSFSYLELNFLSLIIPLVIIVYCLLRIIHTLLSLKSQKRHKVIRLILAVVVVYFLFWTPYNIAMFLSFLQTQHYLLSCEWQSGLNLAMQWVETIAFSHCCLKPIIYAFVGEKFRRAVKEQFPVCFKYCTNVSHESSECRSRSSVYSTTLA